MSEAPSWHCCKKIAGVHVGAIRQPEPQMNYKIGLCIQNPADIIRKQVHILQCGMIFFRAASYTLDDERTQKIRSTSHRHFGFPIILVYFRCISFDVSFRLPAIFFVCIDGKDACHRPFDKYFQTLIVTGDLSVLHICTHVLYRLIGRHQPTPSQAEFHAISAFGSVE